MFDYYPPATSRYCVVEQSGDLSRHRDGSKVASSKIKVGAEIGIPGLMEAQLKYTKERCTNNEMGGNQSALTGGDRSALTGGDRSALTGGDRAALAGGNWSALTGGDGAVLTGGKYSVSYDGEGAKARGGLWSVLAFQDWRNGKLVGVKTAVVDGQNYKGNTWYTLKDGEIAEADE